MNPLLRLRGVERRYSTGGSELWALRGVELDIYENEFVAIVGPSGGGKSTLLSIIGLLDAPTGGEYLVEGEATADLNDSQVTAMRARTFGFIFQAFHLLENRRVRDSAELAVLYKGDSSSARDEAGQSALASLGLRDRSESLANVLSGGQRQRVAIARAIATRNPVLLADEPTGNLDSVSGQAVLQELKRLHADGSTIIVVTHSPEVASMASRVVRISDGQIIEDSGSGLPPSASEPTSTSHTAPIGRLRPIDILRDAFRSITARPRDAIARVAAVAIAVALTVITLGLSSSAGAQVTSSFDARANLEVTVQWQTGDLSLANGVERSQTLDGVTSAAAISDLGEIAVSVNGESRSTTLHGSSGDIEASTGSKIVWAGGTPRQLRSGEVILGAALAQQLSLGPLAAAPTVTIKGRAYVVVGLIEESRRFPRLAGDILIVEEDGHTLDVSGESTLAIVTKLGAAQQVGQQVAVVLDPYQPEQYVVDVPIDPRTLRQEVEGGVQIALTAFTALAALAAIFTLSSAISASVFARRSEFGLRRAVGARAHHLALLVTSESAMVGVVGGVAGLVLGMVAILVFTILQRWLPVFDWALAPIALVAGVALAILSSAVGAVHAARIRPSEALRS